MSSKKRAYDVIIVGGGAAGMMAAIIAAKQNISVAIIERNDKLGKKILATGNGKCNFTHFPVTEADYYGSFAEHWAEFAGQFDENDTLDFFTEIGMLWKNKNGYLYPYSEQAATVVQCLLTSLNKLGIKQFLGKKICEINRTGNEFIVKDQNGDIYYGKKLILSPGGYAAPKTGSDGSLIPFLKDYRIHMASFVPGLTGIKCRESFCKELSGVRCDGIISLYQGKTFLAKERGEIQLTDYGVSGIPAFQLCRIVGKELVDQKTADDLIIKIDFFPENDTHELISFLEGKIRQFPESTWMDILTGFLNSKVSATLLKVCGVKANQIPEKKYGYQVKSIVHRAKNFEFHPISVNEYDKAQVTAGGVLYREVSGDLEVKKIPGLFLAGEILDMDGKCGGYNLQWAWTSGYISGKKAAKDVKDYD